MADEIRVNGNALSWGSIKIKIDSDTYYGFTSVSYGQKRERVKGYGMGKHHAPRSRSRGKYSVDPVKLGGPKSSVEALRAALAAKSTDGVSYGDVEFEIVIQYFESDETPITVEIERCVIVEETSNEEENPDPLKEEVTIDAMKLRKNGRTLFDNSEGSP